MKDSSWRIGKAPGGRILYNMANGMLRPASEILRGRNPLLPSAVCKHLLQMFDEGVSSPAWLPHHSPAHFQESD